MMTPEEVEAMNRASLVKQKGNAPSETSGGSRAPPVAGGGGRKIQNIHHYLPFSSSHLIV